jgi:hypothetical protein
MEPFQEINTLIQQELENWKEGNFKVSRELYYNMEDSLCANIEKAVWVSIILFCLLHRDD